MLVCWMPPTLGAMQGEQTQGEVSGTVVDSDGGALPGVTVTLEGENLIQASLTITTDAAGTFRVRNLRPGLYTATLTLSGFQTVAQELRVSVGTTASASITMSLAGVEETVIVTSETPLIQQEESALTSSFAEDAIQNTPVAREFTVVTNWTAGFSDKGAYGVCGNQSESESVHRVGAASNMYKLNGVDVTEPTWGSTWTNPSLDTIAEIQVVGVGASAEHGNFSGAAVNTVTKGGTNEFHGTGAYYFQNASLRSDNTPDILDLKRGDYPYDHDANFSFGGPIVQRKMLFFANAGWQSQKLHRNISDAVLDFVGNDPEDYFETNERWRLHGRLDFLLNDKNTFGAMINRDPGSQTNIKIRNAAWGPDTGRDTTYGTTTWLVSWQSQPGDDTYVDLRYSGYRGLYEEDPEGCCDIPPVQDSVTGIRYGTSGFDQNEYNGRWEARGTVTQYVDEFLGGSHDIKVGFEYNDTWSLWDARYTGFESGRAGWIGIYPYGAYGYAYLYTYDAHTAVQLQRPGGFIQDDVTVSDRVNLNLGLRLDAPKVYDTYNARDFPQSYCCTGAPVRDKVAEGSFSNLGPRVGINIDVTGDGNAVFHASYGRYY